MDVGSPGECGGGARRARGPPICTRLSREASERGKAIAERGDENPGGDRVLSPGGETQKLIATQQRTFGLPAGTCCRALGVEPLL